ncbi:MAG: calcium-binding protein, partial [Neisseria zoodegmatis]|uniref:calcium-binding protein n=1 Tax=Neisseria zoodegmatis TaxID=326523 RepID=UPI0026F357B7
PKPEPKPEPKPDDCVDCKDNNSNPDNSFGGIDKNPGNIIDGRIIGTDKKDTIYGTQHGDIIEGRSGPDVIYGKGGDDIIYGGDNGDTLYGQDGNDTLFGQSGNDYLNGGKGDDIMHGNQGNDIYMVERASDQVIEHKGEGVDTVRTYTIDYELPDNVENLILMGKGNLKGTGNDLDNEIIGNSGNNELRGLDGNDRLIGKGGNDWLDGCAGDDYLEGGLGNDTYVFNKGYDKDVICDYDTTAGNHDVIEFWHGLQSSDLEFSRNGNDLTIKANESDILTVVKWFESSAYRIEEFNFDDGSVWDSAAIDKALSAQGIDTGYATVSYDTAALPTNNEGII